MDARGQSFRSLSIPWRGVDLRAWTVGARNAPWLVITHGGALDHSSFRPVAEGLAGDWQVLLWDLPGHGLSQPRPRRFTAKACAEALTAVMDAAEAQTGVLLGFSFGGVVSQIFAKGQPTRVKGLVAYGCFTPHLLPPLVPRALVAATVLATFGGLSWPILKAQFAELCSANPLVRAEVVAAMGPIGKRGFLAMARALLASTDYDPAFRIEAPVAVMMGEHDSNGEPLRRAFEALRAAYDAPAYIIAGAGHCAHRDAPAVFAQALHDGLGKLALGAATPCAPLEGA